MVSARKCRWRGRHTSIVQRISRISLYFPSSPLATTTATSLRLAFERVKLVCSHAWHQWPSLRSGALSQTSSSNKCTTPTSAPVFTLLQNGEPASYMDVHRPLEGQLLNLFPTTAHAPFQSRRPWHHLATILTMRRGGVAGSCGTRSVNVIGLK